MGLLRYSYRSLISYGISGSMESDEAKIFVGGLLREVDEGALRQHFGRYGAVVRAVVVRDRITKNSRGHGFVWFSDPSSAKEALDDIEHVILGKAVSPTLKKVRIFTVICVC